MEIPKFIRDLGVTAALVTGVFVGDASAQTPTQTPTQEVGVGSNSITEKKPGVQIPVSVEMKKNFTDSRVSIGQLEKHIKNFSPEQKKSAEVRAGTLVTDSLGVQKTENFTYAKVTTPKGQDGHKYVVFVITEENLEAMYIPAHCLVADYEYKKDTATGKITNHVSGITVYVYDKGGRLLRTEKLATTPEFSWGTFSLNSIFTGADLVSPYPLSLTTQKRYGQRDAHRVTYHSDGTCTIDYFDMDQGISTQIDPNTSPALLLAGYVQEGLTTLKTVVAQSQRPSLNSSQTSSTPRP